MSRQGHELIDNQYPLQVLPDNKVPKYDAGLIDVEYQYYTPREPADYGYSSGNSSISTFHVDGQG